MTMAAIGALTLPKTTSKSFSIYGAQIKCPSISTRIVCPGRILHIRLLARFSRAVMFLSIPLDLEAISSMPPSCL